MPVLILYVKGTVFSGRHLQLGMVFHAGGTIADALLSSQTASSARVVSASKATAGALLGAATAQLPLQGMQLFSSASATLGNGGQANYAAANAWLDSQATQMQVITYSLFDAMRCMKATGIAVALGQLGRLLACLLN